MPYTVRKADVWSRDIPNRPGTLARLIGTLTKAGGKFEFMIARKLDAGTSRVFLAPIKGTKLTKAAKGAGLSPATDLHPIRIEGPDTPGLGAKLTALVADAGINLRGASAAGLGRQAVFYLAFESDKASKQAARVAKSALR